MRQNSWYMELRVCLLLIVGVSALTLYNKWLLANKDLVQGCARLTFLDRLDSESDSYNSSSDSTLTQLNL